MTKNALRLALISLLFLSAAVAAPGGGATAQSVPQSREQIALSFSPVVKKATPAVVNIFTKKIVRERRRTIFDDPFFKRFFGNRTPNLERERMSRSLGSGVIVRSNGLIITNHHVIEGASEIQVVLSDRREFEAELVLDDERTDLAVLRIDTQGEALPTLEFIDSDALEVGDLVLAIGNPFGVGQTVTSGIVSALARTQVGVADFRSFVQTDAAINPGNSGGALVTMEGKLAGINTAIYSRSGGSIGIGFAIPVSMVRTVLHSAEHGTPLVRAWTGVQGQDLTSDLALGFGLRRPGGVVVGSVYPGGPAARAGLKTGDVILSVNGVEVVSLEALRFRVATLPLGEQAELIVWRDGREITLAFDSEAPPEEPARNEREVTGANPLAGAVVANLSPALAEELERPGLWEGVIVTKIARRSPAHRIGMKVGDILMKVNGAKIERVADVVPALNRKTASWQLVIRRNGKVRSLELSR